MVEMNFPAERDMDENPQQPQKQAQFEPRMFVMQPTKDGEVGDNRLFFSLFQPARFKHLSRWPEDATTWYLKFFVHYTPVVDEETGNLRNIPVVCEPSFNKYAKERLTQPQKVFPEPFPEVTTCEFCEKSQAYWDAYRDAKAEAGIENLSTDDFKKAMQANPEINELRDNARKWAPTERVFFAVFDYNKYDGGDPADNLRFQAYLGGSTILKELFKEYKGGYKFYDPTSNTPIVKVTRDNSAGKRYCRYDLRTINEPANFEENVLEYLLAMDDIPDPFDWVQVWTAGQKLAYINQCPAEETTPEPEEETVTTEVEPVVEKATSPAPPPKPGITPRVKVVDTNTTATTTTTTRRPKAQLSFGKRMTP